MRLISGENRRSRLRDNAEVLRLIEVTPRRGQVSLADKSLKRRDQLHKLRREADSTTGKQNNTKTKNARKDK